LKKFFGGNTLGPPLSGEGNGDKGRGRDEGIGVNFHRHQGSSTPNNFTANLVMHLSTPNILSILKVFEDKSVVCG
jgi:hypothetical protein